MMSQSGSQRVFGGGLTCRPCNLRLVPLSRFAPIPHSTRVSIHPKKAKITPHSHHKHHTISRYLSNHIHRPIDAAHCPSSRPPLRFFSVSLLILRSFSSQQETRHHKRDHRNANRKRVAVECCVWPNGPAAPC